MEEEEEEEREQQLPVRYILIWDFMEFILALEWTKDRNREICGFDVLPRQ